MSSSPRSTTCLGALVLAQALLVCGCTSSVVGGGAGGEGGSGGGSAEDATGTQATSADGATTGDTAGPSQVAVSTGEAATASVTASTGGAGGGGGANPLGDCVDHGTGSSSGAGSWECTGELGCGIGIVFLTCDTAQEGAICDCWVDGENVGTCAGDFACGFPDSCCYALLGGDTTPSTGPFGDCEAVGGSGSSVAGGEQSCSARYECGIGGGVGIECEGRIDGRATCRCEDAKGLLIGTCVDETIVCDFETSCCHAVFDP